MDIFEITVPGYTLRRDPSVPRVDGMSDVEQLLSHLETCFFDANLALILFDQAWQHFQHLLSDRDARQPYKDARQNLDAKRALWQSGVLPWDFNSRSLHMHAHSFVFALEGFWRALGQLQGLASASAVLGGLRDRIKAEVPDLVGVRDSAHHADERVQGLVKSKPLPNPLAGDGRSELVVSVLHGQGLEYTKADGHRGRVEITPGTLQVFQLVLQELVNAFSWEGPPRHLPH